MSDNKKVEGTDDKGRCNKCGHDYRGCLSPDCPVPLDKRSQDGSRDW